MTIYEIYKKYQEDPSYPEILLKAIKNASLLEYEQTKAQLIFDQWADEYYKMNQINRNKYRPVIKKVMKELKNVHIMKRTPSSIGIIYFIHYTMWTDLTKYIQTGLHESNYPELNLLWKICLMLISNFNPLELSSFAIFVSKEFESGLLRYQMKEEREKI